MKKLARRGWFVVIVLVSLRCALSAPQPAPADHGKTVLSSAQLLRLVQMRRGVVVQVNPSDDRIMVRAGKLSGVVVQGVVDDAKMVAALRERIVAARLCRSVSIVQWTGQRLPYIDNLVDVLLLPTAQTVPQAEIQRILVPNGVAFAHAQDRWVKIETKPVPPQLDSWTHFRHAADNNPVSNDREVGCPSGLQWIAKPLWNRDHDSTPTVFGVVSDAGRLFYVLDEGPIGIIDRRLPPRHSLVARNAYNGVLLWKRRLSSWYPSYEQWGTVPIYLNRRLVVQGQQLFITEGINGPVVQLNAADGTRQRVFVGSEETNEILVTNDTLVAGIMKIATSARDEYPSLRSEPFRNAGLRKYRRRARAIKAFDLATGTKRWEIAARYIPSMICSDGAHLFYSTDARLACVDMHSGKQIWAVEGGASKLAVHAGVVVATTALKTQRLTVQVTVQARSTADGALLWQAEGRSLPTFGAFFFVPPELFIADDLVWMQSERDQLVVGLDLHTGAIRRTVPLRGGLTPGHHVRCSPAKATNRFILLNKRGIEFVDLAGGKPPVRKHDWIRGSCRLGIVPCNGLIYAPPNGCNCCIEAYLRGFLAVSSRGQNMPVDDAARLERGPAFGAIGASNKTSAPTMDWPAFRHDGARSGATSQMLEPQLKIAWQKTFSGRLSSPTIANGRLVVAEIDLRTIHAFEARTGTALWSFTAGGAVDSPPTLADGMVVFGAADGCVYCLDAANGKLVWRFRAAPRNVQLGAFGHIESVWPCHGSALVQDGIVYATAGRSSYLDGGIYLVGLDLQTGALRYQQCIHTRQLQQTTRRETFNNSGALTDILVSDGCSIFMRQVKFDRTLQQHSPLYPLNEQNAAARPRVLATAGFLDDSGNKRVYRTCSTLWTGRYWPLRAVQVAVDQQSMYGCRLCYARGWKSPRYHCGDGTLVFAVDHAAEHKVPRERYWQAAEHGNNWKLWDFAIPTELYRWQKRLPIYPRAMVATKNKLLVAGRPDRSVQDTIAALDGKETGRMFVLSKTDGCVLGEACLPAGVVQDGLAVAQGHVYVVTDKRQIVCLTD